MFGFNPVISKSDTFLEFFYEAFVWSFLLHPFIWILVFISIFLSRYIIAVFHRKIIAYSLLFFIPIFLISLSLISIHLNQRISNALLYGTIFIMPIFTFCIIMFIQSSRLKNGFHYNKESLAYKFQGIAPIHQITFLILTFILIFIFTLKNKFTIFPYYIFLLPLPILSFYSYIVYKKVSKVNIVNITFKPSDYVPIFVITSIIILISFVQIGDFICFIPKLNCYFSCGICR